MKSLLKSIASGIGVDTYQRMMTYAIQRSVFTGLGSVPVFSDRQQIWSRCVEEAGGQDAELTYVEFGVYRGRSISYISSRNQSPTSIFVGLDSFEGLPEGWLPDAPAGLYSAGGEIPQMDDRRISFIKGWFQDTWGDLQQRLTSRDNLIVHYDADLYSSTLFALSNIDSLKRSYIALFDEFTGHETRALYNYTQSFNASVSFLGKVLLAGYPDQIMCRITPRNAVQR
jgi:hypothetical protein